MMGRIEWTQSMRVCFLSGALFHVTGNQGSLDKTENYFRQLNYSYNT